MTADAENRIAELERRLAGSYTLLQALIGIRLRSVSDPESQRHLTWLSDVIAAIAMVNRRLSPDGPVDFAAYLEDVANFWRRAGSDGAMRVDLRSSAAPLPDTHATALAIIVHELLSNAARHAFPDGRTGSVAIGCSRAVDGVSLVVRDSGVGADVIVPRDGLALVQGLVHHLGGAVSIETAPGAGVAVRVRLPLDRPLYN